MQLHYIDIVIVRYDIAKVKICVLGDKNHFLQMHDFGVGAFTTKTDCKYLWHVITISDYVDNFNA